MSFTKLTFLCLLFSLLAWELSPQLRSRSMVVGETFYPQPDIPSKFAREQTKARFRYTLSRGFIGPTNYLFYVDDCLESLRVNGREIALPSSPVCQFPAAIPLNLGHALMQGKNEIAIQVVNHGLAGGLYLQADPRDAMSLLRDFLLLGAFTCLVALCAKMKVVLTLAPKSVLVLVFAALALRFWYFLRTPLWQRARDVAEHWQYIAYVAENFSLPPADACWQCHQSPLYYLALGLVQAALQRVGACTSQIATLLQFLSFFLSAATFLLSLKLGRLVLRNATMNSPYRCFVLFVGAMPALVYPGAQVNNDVLQGFLVLLCLWLLQGWWEKGKMVTCLQLSFALVAAILCKLSAVGLVLPVIVCTAFTPRISRQMRLIAFACVIGFTAMVLLFLHSQERVLSVWHFRQLIKPEYLLRNDWQAFLRFNVSDLLAQPYNVLLPSANQTTSFWEYLWRSVYFGDFDFSSALTLLAQLIMLSSFPVLGLIGLGLWRTCRLFDAQFLPVLMSALCLILSLIFFRWFMPQAGAQDVRYILAIIPVGGMLCVRGLEEMVNRGRVIAEVLLLAHFFLCALFLLLLGMAGEGRGEIIAYW